MSSRRPNRLRHAVARRAGVAMLSFTLLLLSACGPKVVYLTDEQESTASPVVSLPEEELLEFVRRFYVDALGVESPVIARTMGRQPPPEFSAFEVTWDSRRKQSRVYVDAASGAILDYRRHYVEWEHYPEEDRKRLEARGYPSTLGGKLTQDRKDIDEKESGSINAVPWRDQYVRYSQEDAFKQIGPLLAYFKQPLDIGAYRIRSDESSGHGRWIFTVFLQYEGVPYIGKRLSVQVSQYSGSVVEIIHEAITSRPQSPEITIGRSKALDAATRSMRRNEHFKWRLFYGDQWAEVDYDVDLQNIVKVIVLPQSVAGMHESERKYIDALPPSQPRYCWQVPFEFTANFSNGLERESRHYIYVDMETGRVIR